MKNKWVEYIPDGEHSGIFLKIDKINSEKDGKVYFWEFWDLKDSSSSYSMYNVADCHIDKFAILHIYLYNENGVMLPFQSSVSDINTIKNTKYPEEALENGNNIVNTVCEFAYEKKN